MKIIKGFMSIGYVFYKSWHYFLVSIFGRQKKVKRSASRILVFCTFFNQFNTLLKRKTGIYLPFSIGKPQDDLLDPIGIYRSEVLEKTLTPFSCKSEDIPSKINFFLPTIDPEILFGGYIAVFNFVKRLIENGYPVRIILCGPLSTPLTLIKREVKNIDYVSYCLQNSEIVPYEKASKLLVIGKNDINVGYSWTTMRQAYHASIATNIPIPVFFIQEYEPIFHSFDSFRFFCDETYTLPHFPIFNSPHLVQFFKENRLGVFSNGTGKKDYSFFKHAIADIKSPTIENLKNRQQKKLLFYARPEGHAGRNVYEVGVCALKKSIKLGVFGDNWEFYGIGSLGLKKEIDLSENGSKLKLLPRVSYAEYKDMLCNFDLGVSLMYSPHPSVPPIEMSKAGMITVTSGFENRTQEKMAKISGNLLVAENSLESITKNLKVAVGRVSDYESRVKSSQVNWPVSWEQVFDNHFIENFISSVRRKG